MIAHLHVHSDASLKDGLGTVQRLVEAVAKSPSLYKALALTDHGSLANAIAFSLACRDAGVKPIVGLEAYVEDDTHDIGHITLLANGNAGFQDLVYLNNFGHATSLRQPAFPMQLLLERNKNLIVLSGCSASPFQKLAFGDAVRLGAKLKGAFGNRFFVEGMFVTDANHIKRAMALSKELKAKHVFTNDAHFPYAEDAKIHRVLTEMKAHYSYDSRFLWLATAEEILDRMKREGLSLAEREWAEAGMERTCKLAEVITEVNFAGASKDRSHHSSAFARLTDLVLQAADRKAVTDRHRERISYELKVIDATGYADYFLNLVEIIRYAKSVGCKVGPGRGSGAGSYVLYLLGVTAIDPIEYDLQFERFLNEERIGMPDVDIDFDSEKRHLVLEWAKEHLNAIPIATYSRYSHRSLVHDLCKTLKIPRTTEKALAAVPPEHDEVQTYKEVNPFFGQCYDAFYGQIRHKGKHAGGVIITDMPVPIERAGDALVAAWTEGKHNELSYAGVTKYDLLGLSALTILRHLEDKFKYATPSPEEASPSVTQKVLKLFKDGDLAGIFQFSGSDGIRRLCMDIAPTSFEDLVAINALYRPGALDVGTAFRYPEWKERPRKIHPLIDDILKSTYGVIVYQEQVMSIFQRVMGGSLAQADQARRVIVKSKPDDPEWRERFQSLRQDFFLGARRCGFTRDIANAIWEEIAAHSRYSFNRAHAVSYAMIAWQLAWWKVFYRADFYAELLNIDIENTQLYIIEALANDIEVILPHVNVSRTRYYARSLAGGVNVIIMPLTAVKYLGLPSAEKIVEERKKAVFSSASDFMNRISKSIVRANARAGLFAVGAFPESASAEVIQIKEEEHRRITKMSQAQRHLEFLGCLIPTRKIVEAIKNEKDPNRVIGFISRVSHRDSRYGEYDVYYVLPRGTFWTREAKFDIGAFVNIEVKDGKLIKILDRMP